MITLERKCVVVWYILITIIGLSSDCNIELLNSLVITIVVSLIADNLQSGAEFCKRAAH